MIETVDDFFAELRRQNERSPYQNPFDYEQHKKDYINYLEVLIEEDGQVYYAVPSHQEGMIKIACEKLGVSRDELNDMVPPEYYFDMIIWLSMTAKVIPVWNDFYMGEPNELQHTTLSKLHKEGLYYGAL